MNTTRLTVPLTVHNLAGRRRGDWSYSRTRAASAREATRPWQPEPQVPPPLWRPSAEDHSTGVLDALPRFRPQDADTYHFPGCGHDTTGSVPARPRDT